MNKILIIEDDKMLLQALVDKFSLEKFDVLTALNGKEGLDASLKNHPDIILLDIIMPVMDGISMLRELKKDAWGQSAKVILLTNLSDAQKIHEVENMSVAAYLVKTDWKIEDVVKIVKDKLQA